MRNKDLQTAGRAQMLTTYEVARVLRLSPYTLMDWRKRGVGPSYVRLSHRAIRYPKSGFAQWIYEHLYGGERKATEGKRLKSKEGANSQRQRPARQKASGQLSVDFGELCGGR